MKVILSGLMRRNYENPRKKVNISKMEMNSDDDDDDDDDDDCFDFADDSHQSDARHSRSPVLTEEPQRLCVKFVLNSSTALSAHPHDGDDE